MTRRLAGLALLAVTAASAQLNISNNSGTINVQQSTPANLTSTVTQGTSPWLSQPSDGTNKAAIKPASTAASTTDPALTVTISPNSAAPDVSQSGTWTVQPGNTANTTAWLVVSNDPCQTGTRTSAAINATANSQLVALSSGKTIYVCSLDIVVGGAENVALVYGTGTTCATGTTGMAGGATAATGWNFAANGGLVKGTGANWVYKTASGDAVCILVSGSSQVSGSVQYVQQ